MKYEIHPTEDGYSVYDNIARAEIAVFPTNKAQDYDAARNRAERYLARLLLGEA